MSLTDQIRKVLKAAGVPLSIGQVMEQLPEGVERATVGILLAQRKRAGEFAASMEDGRACYAWVRDKDRHASEVAKLQQTAAPTRVTSEPKKSAAESHAKPAAAAKKPAAQRERKRDFLAAAEDAQRVLKALEFSRSTASDALELYVASTVDAGIYAALKRSANEAQAALDAFVAGGRRA